MKTFTYVLAILCSVTGILTAQPDTSGRWRSSTLQSTAKDTLAVLGRATNKLFFTNGQTGYWEDATGSQFATTDAGVTWHTSTPKLPLPHKMLLGQFGVSTTGTATTDGGTLWLPFKLPNDTARFVTAFYFNSDPSPNAGVVGMGALTNTKRLAYTTNGGTTWAYIDTVVKINDTVSRWQSFFTPAAAWVDSTINGVLWAYSPGMFGDSVLFAVGQVFFKNSTGFVLGRFNLRNRTARYYMEIGDTKAIFGTSGNIRMATADLGFAGLTAGASRYRLTNGGMTWDSVGPLLRNFSWDGLRFLSPTLGICANGVTTDAGVTWRKCLGSPFGEVTGNGGNGSRLVVIDSLHWFLASPGGRVSRTSDGGMTWTGNGASSTAQVLTAFRQQVILSRGQGLIARSSDSAETFTLGSVPPEFALLSALAPIDTVADPQRLVGVAILANVRDGAYPATVISTDFGATWSKGSRIADLDSSMWNSTDPPVLQWIHNGTSTYGFIATNRGVWRSEDAGSSWHKVSDTGLTQFCMADKDKGVGARWAGGLYYTADGGANWDLGIDLRFFAGKDRPVGTKLFPTGEAVSIISDYLGTPSVWTVRRSRDFGVNWVSRGIVGVTGNYVFPAVVYPSSQSSREMYFLHSSLGVLYSSDSGQTFAKLRSQSGVGSVGNDNHYIYVVLSNNQLGRWRMYESPVASVGTEEEVTTALRAIPNPATDRITLRAPQGRTIVSATLFDPLGREVMKSGSDAQFNASGLVSGMYRIAVRYRDGGVGSVSVVVGR